ncbi:unnamed protein product, partial [Iphiclides podalirius]
MLCMLEPSFWLVSSSSFLRLPSSRCRSEFCDCSSPRKSGGSRRGRGRARWWAPAEAERPRSSGAGEGSSSRARYGLRREGLRSTWGRRPRFPHSGRRHSSRGGPSSGAYSRRYSLTCPPRTGRQCGRMLNVGRSGGHWDRSGPARRDRSRAGGRVRAPSSGCGDRRSALRIG